MPIEVTPSPQTMMSRAFLHPGWSSLPPTGPVRAVECVPRSQAPNSVMSNGLRNPWAPYGGETYSPSAQAGAIRSEQRFAGADSGAGMSMVGSVVGGRPRAMSSVMGGGGGSVIVPSSIGMGGYREDDGWNGSMGRVHQGHAPEMSTAADGIRAIGGWGDWRQQPAGWGNHARMTPTIAAGLTGSDIAPSSWGVPMQQGYGGSHHRSFSVPDAGRRNLLAGDDCAECHQLSGSRSGHRRLSSVPVISQSPLRRPVNLEPGFRRSNSDKRRYHEQGEFDQMMDQVPM
ncbi:hypothetical protein L202_07404 [Cryptococcus amylolentus CBS 6039]|uniref:Uncharacterized protein n=1 Tax=Cryptococcus amylolentus CBS 6039 TaxID=1295533 RepID=A0A1E3HC22_9TREE|nr:hypothetical protein L202_07404 [Cryptococcus amylolentus CBS 6039]ODN73887.1 hypothetical protein L202_07404 [Cryptococcus amylolentus CBS 6039]